MLPSPLPGAPEDTISTLVAELEVAECEKQDLRQYNSQQTQHKVLLRKLLKFDSISLAFLVNNNCSIKNIYSNNIS